MLQRLSPFSLNISHHPRFKAQNIDSKKPPSPLVFLNNIQHLFFGDVVVEDVVDEFDVVADVAATEVEGGQAFQAIDFDAG